ncbi:MAG: hypothetical protein IPM97_09165 [Bdellovibrionaceae bacterium]|nr:hypothetical protein [Pseudobdellovibrionaceae bacterium]
MSKQEGLWQSTCFEVFLSPLGHSQYYEFNFALTPAWNVYVFDAYREPQPPRGTADFALKEMHWNKQQSQLTVKLESTTRLPLFQASLTAVLEEKNSKKHYCALTHRGLKPDFHLRESFTLLRGEKK